MAPIPLSIGDRASDESGTSPPGPDPARRLGAAMPRVAEPGDSIEPNSRLRTAGGPISGPVAPPRSGGDPRPVPHGGAAAPGIRIPGRRAADRPATGGGARGAMVVPRMSDKSRQSPPAFPAA